VAVHVALANAEAALVAAVAIVASAVVAGVVRKPRQREPNDAASPHNPAAKSDW